MIAFIGLKSEWRNVSISNRLIRWPRFCICCGATGPNLVAVSSAVCPFDVPYCPDCVAHGALYAEAAPTLVRAELLPGQPVDYWSHACALALAVSAPFFGLLWLVWGMPSEGALAGCALFLAVMAAAGLCYPWAARNACRQKEKALPEAREWGKRFEPLCLPDCTALGSAVRYVGKQEGMHTFLFASSAYVAAFMEANGGKADQ
jgi:hypothetical protein